MPAQPTEPIAYVPLESAVPAIYVENFIDWTEAAPPDSEAAHRHNFHLLMWFLAGHGRQRIDHRSIVIAPQQLCVIPQGCVHQFEEARGLAGFVVAWTDDLLQSDHDYPRELLQAAHETLSVPAAEQAEFTAISQLISAEYARAPLLGQAALLRHWVCALLIRVERLRSAEALAQPPASASDPSVYQAFARLLHAHYRTHHDVGFYADQLGLSANRLSRVLQQIVGKTAKYLIQERLILEAKRYLQFTDLSIKQIGLALGYADPLHFSKIFKQATQLSPQQYREQQHKMP